MEDLFVFAVSSLAGGSFGAFAGTIVFDKYISVRHNGNNYNNMVIFIHLNSFSPAKNH